MVFGGNLLHVLLSVIPFMLNISLVLIVVKYFFINAQLRGDREKF